MIKKILIVSFAVFFLSGCGEKSEIKDTFCGLGIDARYCKCAFHSEYCESLGMSKGEAKNYVYEKYDEWKNPDLDKLKEECTAKNGVFYGRTCMLCKQNEVATDTKCVPADEVSDEIIDEDDEISDEVAKGECKYDSDCEAVCEGDTAWKRGCNARTNLCENTFDTDCAVETETFGDMQFSKMCSTGVCVRDDGAIAQERAKLEGIKNEMSDEVKAINARRNDLTNVMLDANKNCLNGLADMTNVAILEFATRVGSIMAGGFPDLASASVDYVNDAINKMFATTSDDVSAEKKLKPHEYIKLNCGLYDHFKLLLVATDAELDEALENARKADELLQQLP